MTFALGNMSLSHLVGVHPLLIACVKRAIVISEQDFAVNEGCRTIQRQHALVAAGASKTMDSMHIPHVDRVTGTTNTYGHAVDLVPWIDGTLRWEWGPIYSIAAAMAQAAKEQGIANKLCWGGSWGVYVSTYGGDAKAMAAAVLAYERRHPGPDFVDGPHFQIGRST